MFTIRIADLNIAIKNRHPQLKEFCRDYLTDKAPDLLVEASENEIFAERELSLASLGKRISEAYAESVCVYREICRRLPNYEAFLFHSSVVEYGGRAYAFAAASGVGKSTHASLWLNRFGKDARVINGDKPIFRFKDGKLFAYGTPWCGKEGMNVNDTAQLSSICFIERGQSNEIRKIDSAEAVARMLYQVLPPRSEQEADSLFPLLEKMLSAVPCFVLKCTISSEAVEVAYNALKGETT